MGDDIPSESRFKHDALGKDLCPSLLILRFFFASCGDQLIIIWAEAKLRGLGGILKGIFENLNVN